MPLEDLEDMVDETDDEEGYGGDTGASGELGIDAPSPFSDRPNRPYPILNAGIPIPQGASAVPVPSSNPAEQWWIPKPPKDNSIDYDERNRREAVGEMLRNAPFKDAGKAIEMAMRLEGMLGFDADRKAGVPVMEALMKWSPKLHFSSPSAQVALMRQAGNMSGQPFIPSSTTVDGQKLFQMSPHRYAFPPTSPNDFQPRTVEVDGQKLLQTGPRQYRPADQQDRKDQAAYKRAQYNNVVGELKSLQHSLDTDVMSALKRQALSDQIAELRRKAESIYAPKESGAPRGDVSARYVYKNGKLVLEK